MERRGESYRRSRLGIRMGFFFEVGEIAIPLFSIMEYLAIMNI